MSRKPYRPDTGALRGLALLAIVLGPAEIATVLRSEARPESLRDVNAS